MAICFVRFSALMVLLGLLWPSVIHADIKNWQTGHTIPGTEGVTPRPGIIFYEFDLRYADFSGGLNLSDSSFGFSWLDNARFNQANLSGAYFALATLTSADLTDTVVTGTFFHDTTSRGFTKEQLYSTASYKTKDLQGIGLGENDLSSWNFGGQNLAGARFDGSTLTDANLSQANLMGADFFIATLTNANLTDAVVNWTSFWDTTSRGFTKEQLYSTASYKTKDLAGIFLWSNDLSGWNFGGQNLAWAVFWNSTLSDANLSHANLTGADFDSATLTNADLSQADLSQANLANANLSSSMVTGANLAGAKLSNSSFQDVRDLSRADFSADTLYNQWTLFPVGFDPASKGLTFVSSAPGDLDGREGLTVTDVDLLSTRIRNDAFMSWQFSMFDLNGDLAINEHDLRTWVVDLKKTWFGDANLDGQFDSNDLVFVFFQPWQYEDAIVGNSSWSTGDWNADGEFTTNDLVVAFQDGGYEQGPRPVPEPATHVLAVCAAVGLLGFCRHVRLVTDANRFPEGNGSLSSTRKPTRAKKYPQIPLTGEISNSNSCGNSFHFLN